MTESVLTRGIILASKKKYAQAIRLMEPEVVSYHDASWLFFYTLGLCSLHLGNTGAALDYFKSAYRIDERKTPVLLALGLLFLRRGESGRAVDFYLRAQELEPGNRIARQALEVLRRYGGSDQFALWLESGKYKRLIPPLPRAPGLLKKRALAALRGLCVLAVAAGLAAGGRAALRQFAPDFLESLTRPPERALLAENRLSAEERRKPVDIAGSFRYVLTRDETLRAYDKALRLFTDYHDEAARVEINRILESNATDDVKAKARLLSSRLEAPGFDTIKEKFSYPEVAKESWLYRDCYVVWRGTAANIRAGERSTDFDLLVGYDTRKTLQGTVHVHFDQALAVSSETPVETLGRVTLDQTSGAVSLEGRALHQLLK